MNDGLQTTFYDDTKPTQQQQTAPSLLSFFQSPGTNRAPVEKQSVSFYKGFHNASVYGLDPTKAKQEKTFTRNFMDHFLFNAIPFFGMILFYRFMFKSFQGEAGEMFRNMIDPPRSFLSKKSFLRNGMPTVSTDKVKKETTFTDIIGVDEAKDEVIQYVRFLNNPKQFTKIGARLPKGCLLTGPSGTGKTLIVKAIASEANVPLFTATGADFINVYLGSGPKMIRQLFEQARQNAPSIIFIDEIDAVGDRQSTSQKGGGGEDNRTINQLLKELDGLHFASSQVTDHSSPPIVVFAATNYSENIDPALLRAGRFDRKIVFPMPDRDARCDLFRYYLSKTKLEIPIPWSPTANRLLSASQRKLLGELADMTAGMSPAAIATIVNEACLAAAEDKSNSADHVGKKHLMDSIEKIILNKQAGQAPVKTTSGDPEESARIAARQESARILTAWIFPQQQDVIRACVAKPLSGEKKGRTYTLQKQAETGDPVTFLYLFTSMCVSLAPLVGESIFDKSVKVPHLTPNTQSDATTATRNVLSQVLSYGMGTRSFGMLSFKDGGNIGQGQAETLMSQARQNAAEKIGDERLIVARDLVTALLRDRIDLLRKLEAALLARGSLSFDDIVAILGERPKASPLNAKQMERVYALYSGCVQ